MKNQAFLKKKFLEEKQRFDTEYDDKLDNK